MKNKYIWIRQKCYVNNICVGRIYSESYPEWYADLIVGYGDKRSLKHFDDRNKAEQWVEQKAKSFIKKLTNG